jgi:hypothetical protein
MKAVSYRKSFPSVIGQITPVDLEGSEGDWQYKWLFAKEALNEQ